MSGRFVKGRSPLQGLSSSASALTASSPLGHFGKLGASFQKARKAPCAELFLDDEFLDMTAGVTRKIHQPLKHTLNPVLAPEQWWEGDLIWPMTTLYDREEKLFKMWYRTGPIIHRGHLLDGHASYSAYATSKDAVHWERPNLGALKLAGREDHNVVLVSEGVEARYQKQGKKAFIFSVVKHPHPNHEDEKYVGLIFDLKIQGAYIGYSADGIHWRKQAEPFWQTLCDIAGWGDDSIMCLIYDIFKERWVIYRRVNPQESEHLVGNAQDANFPTPDRGLRILCYADSEDLRHWENHQIVLKPDADDPSDVEFYGMSCQNYGQVYVGYLWVYHQDPDQQTIDVQLVTSRDGVHFQRCCRRETFVPNGPYNSYDHMIVTSNQPEPLIVDDVVYLLYSTDNYKHTDSDQQRSFTRTCAGLLTFPRDQFVSLEAGVPEPSRIVTKPFVVETPKLFVNASTWGEGSIAVEVLTRGWENISGYTAVDAQVIRGNYLNHPVRWKDKGDLGNLVGKEVRLKFNMRKARLHALYCDTTDRPNKELPTLSEDGTNHAQLPVER